MATNTVTQPVEFPQPKQIARQGLTIIVLLVVGLVLGMLIDTGRRTGSVEAAQLTQSQQATADRLSAQAAELTQGPQAASDLANAGAAQLATGPLTQAQQAVADRLGAQAAAFRIEAVQDLADSIAAVTATLPEPTQEQLLIDLANRGAIPAAAAIVEPSVVPEHGPFTAMQYRDSSVVQERFSGPHANFDPDVAPAVIPEHGPFTAMQYRDPSGVQERFSGPHANLDPDVAAAEHEASTATGSGGYYDPYTSQWVPKQSFADEAVEFSGYYDPYTSQWAPLH